MLYPRIRRNSVKELAHRLQCLEVDLKEGAIMAEFKRVKARAALESDLLPLADDQVGRFLEMVRSELENTDLTLVSVEPEAVVTQDLRRVKARAILESSVTLVTDDQIDRFVDQVRGRLAKTGLTVVSVEPVTIVTEPPAITVAYDD